MIKPNWILQRTKLSPENVALIDVHTDESWTYAQLEAEIINWVDFLQSKDCERGDRIVVLSHNRKELFAIMFACGILGLVYVPINWRLSSHEWEHLLRDADAKLFIYDDAFAKNIEQLSFDETILLGEVTSSQQT